MAMRDYVMPVQAREEFNRVHAALLAVHKELLDHERVRYERQHGAIGSANEVLQLVIKDPWFAWLRPLTVLITQIDEFVESKSPPPEGDGAAILAEAKRLLTPLEEGDSFQHQYLHAIQESAEVASAHGEWRAVVRGMEKGV